MKRRAKPGTETAVPARRSFGNAAAVVQCELRVYLRPVLPTASPLFGDVQHGEIQHLEQAVICRENSLGFSHLPQLPIEALYGIGRINQPPKLLRELEICAEICPVSLQDFEILEYFLPQISAKSSRAAGADCSSTV